MPAEAAIFIFWASFFGFLSVKKFVFKTEDSIELRIKKIFQPPGLKPGRELLLTLDETPGEKRLKQTLLQAGLKRGSDLEKLLLFRKITLILPLMFTCTLFFLNLPWRHVVFTGVILTVIFLLVPRLWVLSVIFRRRKEIQRNLPNALDLLVLCLEAGLGFDAALVRVAEEMQRVSEQISREFVSANHELLAGKPRDQALKNLAARCGVPDLDNLVGAIVQSVKLGTSLVKTMRVQAEALRKKRRERIRAQILKTPVKLIFPLLFFIFPTLVIVILGPSMINIFRHLSH